MSICGHSPWYLLFLYYFFIVLPCCLGIFTMVLLCFWKGYDNIMFCWLCNLVIPWIFIFWTRYHVIILHMVTWDYHTVWTFTMVLPYFWMRFAWYYHVFWTFTMVSPSPIPAKGIMGMPCFSDSEVNLKMQSTEYIKVLRYSHLMPTAQYFCKGFWVRHRVCLAY